MRPAHGGFWGWCWTSNGGLTLPYTPTHSPVLAPPPFKLKCGKEPAAASAKVSSCYSNWIGGRAREKHKKAWIFRVILLIILRPEGYFALCSNQDRDFSKYMNNVCWPIRIFFKAAKETETSYHFNFKH